MSSWLLQESAAAAPDLGHGVSLNGFSSKAQPLLLTLDEGYLLSGDHCSSTAQPPQLMLCGGNKTESSGINLLTIEHI